MSGDPISRALVTGASGSIGRAVVDALADNGFHVFAADLVAPGSAWPSPAVLGMRMDVRDPDAVNEAVGMIEEAHGPIDVLVNVAGALSAGSVLETTPAQWAEMFAVNAGGVFHTSRAVARSMINRRSGCIVTISSNAAGVPRSGLAAYAASKAAASHFTRCLGLELAPHGIRCNVVSPGSTDTPMLRSLWADPAGASRTLHGDPGTYRVGIPLGRIADPADVADAVLFLCSPAARHITMQELYVDGGAALRA